jgi:L-2,4-diaminobutyrate decarboxylase
VPARKIDFGSFGAARIRLSSGKVGSDDPLRGAYDPEAFRRQGHALVDKLADYLAVAMRRELPVVRFRPPDELAEQWSKPLGPEPIGELGALVDAVVADALHQHHPRCTGHQVSAPLPVAALADLVVAVLNNGMASYESGPVSSALERHVVRFLAGSLGFGPDADGVLTSGGTLGNLTALLAARARSGATDLILNQLPQPAAAATDLILNQLPAVLVSEHAHYSVARAARVMGWGDEGVVDVPADAAFRMRVEALGPALAHARERGRRVVAVVATAGVSSTGAFDPLEGVARFCESNGLWLHVDAAHGASAALSAKYRELCAGVERADSVVWDAHKLLGLPAPATAVIFKNGETGYAPFAERAHYLYAPGGSERRWYDFGLRNLECTKRMMSVTAYLVLASLGTAALDDYVTGRFDLARRFAAWLAAEPDFSIACEPSCNIVCFRYERAGADDGLQDRIRARLLEQGEHFVTRTTLGGRPHLRVTIMNPLTSDDDLRALVDAVRRAAREV